MPSQKTPFASSRLFLALLTWIAAAAPAGRARAGENEAPCDLRGSWAVGYAVPLTWRLNAGLEGGQGELFVAGVIDREAAGEGRYLDTLHVCHRAAPTTRTLLLYGGERYASSLDLTGVAWADLPSAQAELRLDADGRTFTQAPLAILYGLRLEPDELAPFPRTVAEASAAALPGTGTTQRGVRLAAETHDGLQLPPVNARRTRRAVAFDAVLRDVLSARGLGGSCDALQGEAQIVAVGGKEGLQASLVGCELADGSRCTRSELSLVNAFQPAFRSQQGEVRMVRLAPGAGCDEVRAALGW